MMKRSIVAALVLAGLALAPAALADDTTRFVQSSLAALGHDPGPVDGQWGGKSREALNALRSEHGLDPADGITGSALALLHRLVPGEATLPSPGKVVVDAVARRSFLQEHADVARRHCNNALDLPGLDVGQQPVVKFTEKRTLEGYIANDEDWMSPVAEGLSLSAADCLGGSDAACRDIVTVVGAWAGADALQTPVARRARSDEFDGVAWMANTVLSPMIVSYATARSLVDVDPTTDALILDWLHNRTLHYNYISDHNTKQGDPRNSLARNHAVAATLPSVALGALIGDRSLFDQGRERWVAALSNMRKDGSFPTETQRGARSLHYTGLQLGYLTAIAEVYAGQDEDLYALAGSASQTIHDAVAFNTRAWSDYGVVADYAAANHSSPSTPDSPMATYFEGYFGWLPAYQGRFPGHENVEEIGVAMLDPVICSPRHMEQRKSNEWWCRTAGPQPLSLRAMLLDNSTRPPSLGAVGMGFRAGCYLATSSTLFPE